MTQLRILPFPLNKQFAFSLVDDTDEATFAKVKISYAFLDTLGIKTTKTVWAFPPTGKSGDGTTGKWCEGATLANPDYLLLIKDLAQRGHEIALHTASGGNNLREKTISAYDVFKREFGAYPVMNIMHGRNSDNLYYGKDAYKGLFRFLVGLYSADTCEGHFPQSPFFWGDICAAHSRYVRFYKGANLNTLCINPSMPYHDPAKPFVPRWFSSTDLADEKMIRRNLTLPAIERLIHDQGACIGYAYVHRYIDDSLKIHPVIEERLVLLNRYKDHAWFTPASLLLDRLERIRNVRIEKQRGRIMIINHNADSLNDVWIRGPEGTRVYCENGEQIVLGSSGIGHCNQVPASVDISELERFPRLRIGEELRMILSQAHLLFLRHAMGRPVRRKGF